MPVLRPWPDDQENRAWQDEGLETYLTQDRENFLLEAAPGSGKTWVALGIAHGLLRRGLVKRVVVVVPTEYLKGQWADEAHKVGIALDPEFVSQNGAETSDFHGIVVTYAAVAKQPRVFAVRCRHEATLVIFDECHHMGDHPEMRWGPANLEGFGPAVRRLLLSGTPFRHDNHPIPFVEYVNNKSHADYSYSYGRAVQDGVCRQVLFPALDGRMEWRAKGVTYAHTFQDALPDEEARRRLRTALDTHQPWLRELLRRADDDLSQFRFTDGHAKGLVVCIEQWHAREIAVLLKQITGLEPVLIVSDDPTATQRLKLFKKSPDRWAVAVRMVSEGIDIPRLRVGVYATNIITELYFRQFVGRFVRGDGFAYVRIPEEVHLIEYARRVDEEIAHAIDELLTPRPPRETGERTGGEAWTPISAESAEGSVVYDHGVFGAQEWGRAETIGTEIGLIGREAIGKLAAALRRHGPGGVPVAGGPVSQPGAGSEKPVHEQRRNVRTTRQLAVTRLAYLMEPFTTQDFSARCEKINGFFKYRYGGPPGKLSLTEIEEQRDQLIDWIDHLKAAIAIGRGLEWLQDWEAFDGRS